MTNEETLPTTEPGYTEAERRRGPLRAGERVQLTDPKGKFHTIVLNPGGSFHTHRGHFSHDEVIGKPEGSVIASTTGIEFLVFRHLLDDYVLSMPRGAAVVYPKDAAHIVQMADIFPGATVIEAGVGSGALTLSLLRAIGSTGVLHSIERRDDFAAIAEANVANFFGAIPNHWQLHSGNFAEVVSTVAPDMSVDRVVLDMLAPWENIDAAATSLRSGGVLICYVATATQLSRVAEEIRKNGSFTEPHAWESMVRGWHLEGLAVRPEHRMVGHSGFLIQTRRLAAGVVAPERRRRPAKGNYPTEAEWTPEDLGERTVSDRKVRRVRRDLGR